MLLFFVLACGSSICGDQDALTAWPGPWADVALPVSETAGVCRNTGTQLQRLRTGGNPDAVLGEVEAALVADGWTLEDRAPVAAVTDWEQVRSYIKDDALTEVRVNASVDGKLVVTTLYDKTVADGDQWSDLNGNVDAAVGAALRPEVQRPGVRGARHALLRARQLHGARAPNGRRHGLDAPPPLRRLGLGGPGDGRCRRRWTSWGVGGLRNGLRGLGRTGRVGAGIRHVPRGLSRTGRVGAGIRHVPRGLSRTGDVGSATLRQAPTGLRPAAPAPPDRASRAPCRRPRGRR